MPDIIGVNFHPVMGQDQTTFEAFRVQTLVDPLTRPSFGKVKSVTDVSAMSPVMLVVPFHFSPLNVNQTCFPGRTVDSPCTLFTFTYLLRCVA